MEKHSQTALIAENTALKDQIGQLQAEIALLRETLKNAKTPKPLIKNPNEDYQEIYNRFRLICKLSNFYFFSTQLQPDGKIQSSWVEGAFEEISGYTLEEYIARGGWRSIIFPEDFPVDDRDFANLQLKRDVNSELRTIRKNGEIVWMHIFAYPVWDKENDYLSGVYGFVQEITERKKYEQELIRSQKEIQSILDASIDVVALVNDEGKFVSGNERLANRWGRSSDEMIGHSAAEVLPPHIFRHRLENIHEAIATRTSKRFTDEYDGKFFEVVIVPVTDPEGPTKTVAMFSRDITESKKIEEELQKSRTILRSMIDALPMWIAASDTEGKYFIANTYYVRTFKVPLDCIENHNFREFFPPEMYDRHKALLDECVATGKFVEVNDEVEFEKGKISYIYGGYTPLFDSNGKIFGISAAVMDITKQKIAENTVLLLNQTLEERVRQRTNQLEEVNKELEAFAYSISHNLRAPLRHIDGFLQILKENYKNNPETAGYYFKKITESSDRMAHMIDDLLKFSRISR